MKLVNSSKYLPRYKGTSWIKASLPGQGQVWMMGKQHSVKKDKYHSAAYAQEMRKAIGQEPWKWPERRGERNGEEGGRRGERNGEELGR